MCQEVKEACFCSCSGGVPRGSSSSFPSPNESPPSALGGAVGWEASEHREGEGGTETVEVVRSAVQGMAVSVLRSAFVRSEPKERQGRDCMRSVCHPLRE